MKNLVKNFLVLFFVTIFVCVPKIVNADVSYNLNCNADKELENGIVERTCKVNIDVEKNDYNKNVLILNLKLQNFYINSINANDNWTLSNINHNDSDVDSEYPDSYTFEYNKPNLAVGKYEVVTIVFYKINPNINDSELCKINYQIKFDKVSRICYFDIKKNTYYGKNEMPVTELEYQKECEKNICKILSDGTFYGRYGQKTDENTYLKECVNVECSVFLNQTPDGITTKTYYGKDGRETNENTYNYECLPHYCEKVYAPSRVCNPELPNCYDNGVTVYYDQKGNETSLETYTKNCFTHTCEIIFNTYFGKNSIEVSKSEYQKECEKNECKIIDDTYFGKSGNIVDQLTYRKECEKITCEKLSDGTYYNRSGKEVTELEYQKDCEKNVCQKLSDGTYYDQNGKVTDEITYNQQCLTHKCEKVGNIYYDQNGKVTDKTNYDKYCGTLSESPQTGMKISLICLLVLFVSGVTAYIVVKKHDRLF